MNKFLLPLLSVILIGCASHAKVITNRVTPTTVATVQAPEPVVPKEPLPEQEAKPTIHTGPFQGDGWSLSVGNDWIGREADGGLMAMNGADDRSHMVKLIIVSAESDMSLQELIVKDRADLMVNGVKTGPVKMVVIDGVKGGSFLSYQGRINAYLTMFSVKYGDTKRAVMFGCGGLTTNKGLEKTCEETIKQLHFDKTK